VEPSQVLGEVEFILGDEYDKVVFHHPSYSTAAHTISYFFLLAIYSQTGKSRLFSTYENTMHEVTGHVCIGVEQELAQYILGPAVSQGRTEREATLTAAYMLNKVKEHVPGCGGMSQFVAMRPDGAVEILDPFPYSEFARYASMIHDGAARRLLLSCADDGDAQFQEQLDVFSGVSRSIRDYWKQINREDPLVRQIRNMRKE
jgi:hypothetical protein